MLCLLAVCGALRPAPSHAQGTCQGGAFTGSAPAAPMLGTFLPVASDDGVIIHGFTDASPARARLIVENTNPHPVAVRFRVMLNGNGGARTLGQSCVMVRHHEFAVGDSAGIAFPYRNGTRVTAVRVADLRVRALPLELAWRDPGPAVLRARAVADSSGAVAGLTSVRPPGEAAAGEPHAMRAVASALRVAFGVVLSVVGAMLLVPVLAAAFLLLVRTPLSLLRQGLRGRRRPA